MGYKGYRLKMIIYHIKRRLRPVYWRIKGELKDIIYRGELGSGWKKNYWRVFLTSQTTSMCML